jgi:hypothetical protein
MHAHIAFPLTVLMIPRIAHLTNFLLEALNCLNDTPTSMHFLKPTNAYLDARSATFIRTVVEAYLCAVNAFTF